MARLEIRYCDMCGKRTDQLIGKITLTKENYHGSQRTVWSRKMCNTCMKKMSSLITPGDRIREQIEMALDQIRIDTTPIIMLDGIKIKEK